MSLNKALAYAGALLLTSLAALALGWAAEHYTQGPTPGPVFDDPRLSFQRGAHLARRAVQRYRELPRYERRALAAELQAALGDLDAWSERAQRRSRFLCLGERHESAVRAFVGRWVLSRLDFDVLMLETGQAALHEILTALDAGHPVSLLGARIDPVLVAARTRPSPAVLEAIDESSPPRGPASAGGASGRGSRREDRLVSTLREHWRPERRHVVLFGALHCRDVPGWMFHRVAREAPRIAASGMHATVLLARYQEQGAQLLFYLLEEIGLGRDVVTVPDVGRFPRLVQRWLPPLADALAGYDSAILFDEKALGLAPSAPGTGHD